MVLTFDFLKTFVATLACYLVLGQVAAARLADPIAFEVVSPDLTAVPQNLLKLVHTPEVQKELQLIGDPLVSFLTELAAIDGPWWRSRIKPEAEQRKIIATQEKLLVDLLNKFVSSEKMQRLKQIELQSQGTRIFARPDVIKATGLTTAQSTRLTELYAVTDRASKKLQEARAQDQKLIDDVVAAKEAEAKGIAETLTTTQRTAFSKLMGTPFDTMKLARIYPLAPELVDSGHWAGGGTANKLANYRGKVVLLHFYAFQCHNCVANFGHYNRWHEQLSSRGVSVIGIQTPETSAERDVKLVQKAAKDKGFKFPVLIDVASKNWDAWSNTMWPTVYVIDKNGYIRFWHQGELNWDGATVEKTIEKIVDELLAE